MRKRILSFILAAMMLVALMPAAMAATFDEINDQEVFFKQAQQGTCTLASTAMMLRRTAMLQGDPNWQDITEASCRKAFWKAGRGLPYNFTYNGMTVTHQNLPGGQANRQLLIDMLAQHPEGIMLHARCVPHGILLTDYTDGVFYCADPAENVADGRVPIDQANGTRIENASAIWYVVTPDVALDPDLPDLNSTAQDALTATDEELVGQPVYNAAVAGLVSKSLENQNL